MAETSKSGSDLFIIDNSDQDWKVRSYLSDWCELSKAIDIATGFLIRGTFNVFLYVADSAWGGEGANTIVTKDCIKPAPLPGKRLILL